MEVEDIQSSQQPATKYSRLHANGTRLDSSKMGLLGSAAGGGGGASNMDDKTDIIRRVGPAAATTTTGTAMNGGGGEMVSSTRFGRQWQHSSRIIRVSRASGGKDRHSKVWTAKGPRDRRVRLSVTTAIQFYDLQDRLGYDQPSKAVEWLIKAAADSISELPSLNNANFPPETPRQLSDERRSGDDVVDSADVEFDEHTNTNNDDNNNNNNFVQDQGQLQHVGSMSMSKSGCSSNNSETSKGSGLSLSRTEIRVKARERARERTAKEKEKDSTEPLSGVSVAVQPPGHHSSHQQQDAHHQHQQQHNVSCMSQGSSFTQLLTAGITNLNENAAPSSTPSPHQGSSSSGVRGRNDGTSNHFQWLSSSCTTPYFETGLMGLSTTRPNHSIQQLPQVMTISPFGAHHNDIHHHHHHHHHQQQQQQQQHLPFFADQHHHLIQVPNNTTTTTTGAGAGASGGGNGGTDYNLNFSISSSSTTSGLAAGFSRGTLQSNSSSPSFLSYLQRYSATDGVASVPFFLGGAPISPAVDNHNHHHTYDLAGLQLCYGDGGRHSDHKGKGKN